mmetsp:Transcript_35918/g.102291  ORF Transcript_35918/g.102291 Transcript_35918/m.102291 type:complete len:200 (+) Transcript_35918:673-1272(+)
MALNRLRVQFRQATSHAVLKGIPAELRSNLLSILLKITSKLGDFLGLAVLSSPGGHCVHKKMRSMMRFLHPKQRNMLSRRFHKEGIKNAIHHTCNILDLRRRRSKGDEDPIQKWITGRLGKGCRGHRFFTELLHIRGTGSFRLKPLHMTMGPITKIFTRMIHCRALVRFPNLGTRRHKGRCKNYTSETKLHGGGNEKEL